MISSCGTQKIEIADMKDFMQTLASNSYLQVAGFLLTALGVILAVYYGRKAIPKIFSGSKRSSHGQSTYVEKNSGTINISHNNEKK